MSTVLTSRSFLFRRGTNHATVSNVTKRLLASTPTAAASKLPDSITRVGVSDTFPNEYPGQIYSFNWCLNGDGVTPLRKSAFRISKPLDLKVAGLEVPKKNPLKVTAAKSIPEAGASDALSFAQFDEVSGRVRDLLSLSEHLYCPEGHIPGTRTATRVITNSAKLAVDCVAYLDRAPRVEPPVSLPVTVYALEGAEETFQGLAIEETEVQVPRKGEEPRWITDDEPDPATETKSVAAIVLAGKTLDLKVLAAGLEHSHKALQADELERQWKKNAASEE